MRVTLKRVNEALKKAGADCELVRGNGYFYFTGKDADHFEEQGVYGVFRVDDLTLEQWVEEWKSKMARAAVRRGEVEPPSLRFLRVIVEAKGTRPPSLRVEGMLGSGMEVSFTVEEAMKRGTSEQRQWIRARLDEIQSFARNGGLP